MEAVKNNVGQYAEYKEKQLMLVKLMERAEKIVSELNMQQYAKNLDVLGEKIHNESFKIQVVGTFKNGKSTFINSFLGEDILPAYSIPCTAIINEVKWGATKKAILYFRDPLPDKLPDEIPEATRRHMEKFRGTAIPPMEIPYDEIEDYVVIPVGDDPKQAMLESPYSHVELFYPLPLLENNIEIIDSPGLNEHETRTRVTMDYLSKADAILFVLDATKLCSADEMAFVENNLKAQGFNDPFFVVNRFDLIPPRESKMTEKFARQKLNGYSSNDIYYVSALNALVGKTENDPEKYEGSGMAEFEKRLSDFLTREKGKAKLIQPAREVKRIINEEAVSKTLPAQRKMLSTSLDEVKAKYEEVKPKLAVLESKKTQILDKMTLKVEQALPELERKVRSNIADICGMIPAWVDEAKVTPGLGIIQTKANIEKYTAALVDIIRDNIENYQVDWKKDVFMPSVKEKIDSVVTSVEGELKDFYSKMDKVQSTFNGENADENGEEAPVWERIAGMAGNPVLAQLSYNDLNGWQGSLGRRIASGVGTYLLFEMLALLNPILLVGGLIAVLWGGASSAEKKVKTAVSKEIVNRLSENADEQAKKTVEDISDSFRGIVNGVSVALDGELEAFRTQMDSVISELEKGKASVSEKLAQIDEYEKEIVKLCNELDNFMLSF